MGKRVGGGLVPRWNKRMFHSGTSQTVQVPRSRCCIRGCECLLSANPGVSMWSNDEIKLYMKVLLMYVWNYLRGYNPCHQR